ncbi:hypothetical protein, partial [Klebsiella pneumoniae]
MASDDRGRSLLQTTADGGSLYLAGAGASPEGDRPFVDRFDVASGKATRLFHSQAPTYAAPVTLLDAQASSLLISRESPDEPTNFYVQSLADTNAAP